MLTAAAEAPGTRRLGLHAAGVGEEQRRGLLRAADAHGARVIDWTVYGPPADGRLRAGFEVAQKTLPALVESLVKDSALRLGWRVSPHAAPFERPCEASFWAARYDVVLTSSGLPRP
jgi:hypothetical protein